MCRRLEYLSEVSFGNIDFETCKDTEAFETFVNFFENQARGRLNSFLYKNPLDFKGTAILANHGLETSSRIYGEPIDLQNYQLLKEYRFGGIKGYKTLHFIDSSTLTVYVDGEQTNNFILLPGGIIQLTTTVFNEVAVTADCEFYLRYRFGEDKYTYQRTSVTKTTITSLTLSEITTTNRSPIDASNLRNTRTRFELGWDPSYTEESKVETYLDQLPNTRREVRQARFTSNKRLLSIDGNPIYPEEKDNLLCMFVALKGSLLEFRYDLSVCRLETDSLILSTKRNALND